MENNDLTCRETLDDTNDGGAMDREVARVMAVTPMPEAQSRALDSSEVTKMVTPPAATPEKPPEPQHEETVCSGEEVLPVCRAANWGSAFKPIQLDDLTVEANDEGQRKRHRAKRSRQPATSTWFSATSDWCTTPPFDRATEQICTHFGMLRDVDQTYPYVRRHAHRYGGLDGAAFFTWLGLRETGDHRIFPDGEEEFALAAPILLQLDQADWRLYSLFNANISIPVAPPIADHGEVNSVVHDHTDRRFSIAPMFAPPVGGITRMRQTDWMGIQRGMFLALEELARQAIHDQSAILHAMRRAKQLDVGSLEQASMESLVESLMNNQTSALIALLHHVVYAHRHALVRDRSTSGKAVVLRQPIFAKRRLFERYVTKD